MKPRIGVDVGGVIIDRANDDTDTSFFSDNYLNTRATPGCFDQLSKLTDDWEIHIVSKCGSKIQAKTQEWLLHHDLYKRVKVDPTHVHFCRTREEKAPICKDLGIQVFIDDRLEVLRYMKDIVDRRILFMPTIKEIASNPAGTLDGVAVLHSWSDVLAIVKNRPWPQR